MQYQNARNAMSCDSLIFCAATVFPAVIKTRRMGRLLYLLYAKLPKVICHSEHSWLWIGQVLDVCSAGTFAMAEGKVSLELLLRSFQGTSP